MVPAASAAGAHWASEAPAARLVSAGPLAWQAWLFAVLEEQRPQAWGTLLLLGGLFKSGAPAAAVGLE